MESETLEDLVTHFSKKVSVLKNAVLLTGAVKEAEYVETAESLDGALDNVVEALQCLRIHVDSQKKAIAQVEKMKKEATALTERLRFAKDNVPTQMCPKPVKESNPAAAKSQESESGDSNQNIENKPPAQKWCAFLCYLTVEDFDCIPKYMKGRLTYEKINSVIEKLDHVYVEKYKILKLKKSSLNDIKRKRYEAYKLQETKDTPGVEFIVDDDITEFSSLKVDTTMRNILTILRHFNLIYEIRGGIKGLVRYAVNRNLY